MTIRNLRLFSNYAYLTNAGLLVGAVLIGAGTFLDNPLTKSSGPDAATQLNRSAQTSFGAPILSPVFARVTKALEPQKPK